MIRLKDILVENKENRTSLFKLTALMEKLLPELNKTNATKLTTLCTEAHTLVSKLNDTPHTIFNNQDWKVMKVMVVAKLMEIKVEAEKLLESDKVDIKPFIKALDEVIAE